MLFPLARHSEKWRSTTAALSERGYNLAVVERLVFRVPSRAHFAAAAFGASASARLSRRLRVMGAPPLAEPVAGQPVLIEIVEAAQEIAVRID